MKIEHIAIWTNKLEEMKDFYVKIFNGKAGEKYINSAKQFESYFITFENGARLELMTSLAIKSRAELANNICGYTHVAFSVGSKSKVDSLTKELKEKNYIINSQPRTTGDGYYESSFFDPDGNLVEITE